MIVPPPGVARYSAGVWFCIRSGGVVVLNQDDDRLGAGQFLLNVVSLLNGAVDPLHIGLKTTIQPRREMRFVSRKGGIGDFAVVEVDFCRFSLDFGGVCAS